MSIIELQYFTLLSFSSSILWPWELSFFTLFPSVPNPFYLYVMFISFNFMAFTRFHFTLFNCPRLSISMSKRKKEQIWELTKLPLWMTWLGSSSILAIFAPPILLLLPVPDCQWPIGCHRTWGLPAILTDALRWWGQGIMYQNQIKSLEIIAYSCSCVSIKWIDPPIWASKDDKGRYGWVIKHMLYILDISNMNFLFPIKRTWEILEWE